MSETYTIRPLEWKQITSNCNMQAATPFGAYEVWPYNEGDARHYWADPDAIVGTRVASIDEAKAAAEAHYRSRLLPALAETKGATHEK